MEVTPDMDPASINRQRIRTRRQRRFLSGLNSTLAIVLMLTLVIMLNYLSSRNYLRFDWSRDHFYQLSDKTLNMLTSLTDKVRITVFIQPSHDIYHLIYDDVLRLLREYEYASGNQVVIERIDPDRNLARAEDIMTRYQLEAPNVILVEFGDRRRIISADELVEMDYRPMARGESPQKVSFRGEQIISSAILSLTQERHPKVYFFQGHGERDFDDRDEYVGLSAIARLIRRDDIELESMSFVRRNTIPEDADAIVIAGPTRPFSASELDRIAAYVNRAGRLILMLNSESDAGFGPMLQRWGLDSIDNLVVDPTRTLSGFDLLVADYGQHPITARLKDITTVFYWPRALPIRLPLSTETHAADEHQVTMLAQSSANAWAEVDLDQRPYRFDADRDIKGPVPVAVAIERGPVNSVVMDIKPTRVVIYGDVDFISNSGLSGGNSDLFMNSLNWILERDNLMAIAPKPVEEIKLLMSRQQLTALFWSVAVGLPAIVAALGCIVWWRRRR